MCLGTFVCAVTCPNNVLFGTAFGVLIDGVLMEVVSATESEAFGAPYVYRLVLRAPLALVV